MEKVELDKIAARVTSWVQIPAETDFLYKYACEAKHGLIEIGSWLGRSTLYLAAAGRENKIPVIAIDTWKDCDLPGMAGADFLPAFVYNLTAAGYNIGTFNQSQDGSIRHEDWSEFAYAMRFGIDSKINKDVFALRLSSNAAAQVYQQFSSDIRFDFLFIDGDHSYEAVRQDYLTWSQKLARPATVIFHDLMCFDGPKRFFGELVESDRLDFKSKGNIGAVFLPG